MQNINKELSLCSQLGTDAQPEACRCVSAIRPHGGPHFKAVRTRMQSSDVFHLSNITLKISPCFLFANLFTVSLGLQAIKA